VYTVYRVEHAQRLVAEYHAVVTSVCFSSVDELESFKNYTGGIFDGCESSSEEEEEDDDDDVTEVCQAVTVVGYGREEDTDFWLAKNSWGEEWGERGYFRLERGVDMCRVGGALGVVSCSKDKGGRRVVAAECEGGKEECGDQEEGETTTTMTSTTKQIQEGKSIKEEDKKDEGKGKEKKEEEVKKE